MAIAMQGEIIYAKEAGENLSSALFTFATVHSDGLIYQANAGDAVIGVIIEAAAIGAPVSVQCTGIAKVKLSGTLNAGDRVTSDSSGLASAVSGSLNANGVLLGGGNVNEIVPVLLGAAA